MCGGRKSEVGGQSWAGWICAAVVMALFGLQQIFPLFELARLSSSDSFGEKLLHALTCQLVHGSFMHVYVNALAFICLFCGARRGLSRAALAVGFVAGWCAAAGFSVFIMPQHATLVGCSGIIFGALGVFTAAEPLSRWKFCFVGSIPLIILAPIGVVADGVVSAFFMPYSAWPVHSAAFVAGAVIAVIFRLGGSAKT